MIKFVYKKYLQENLHNGKIIIYYNFFDIFIGAILLVLVFFFIRDYISHALLNKSILNSDKVYQNRLGASLPMAPL